MESPAPSAPDFGISRPPDQSPLLSGNRRRLAKANKPLPVICAPVVLVTGGLHRGGWIGAVEVVSHVPPIFREYRREIDYSRKASAPFECCGLKMTRYC
jgi:hypothetical protein